LLCAFLFSRSLTSRKKDASVLPLEPPLFFATLSWHIHLQTLCIIGACLVKMVARKTSPLYMFIIVVTDSLYRLYRTNHHTADTSVQHIQTANGTYLIPTKQSRHYGSGKSE
jgi:hypothetical protein